MRTMMQRTELRAMRYSVQMASRRPIMQRAQIALSQQRGPCARCGQQSRALSTPATTTPASTTAAAAASTPVAPVAASAAADESPAPSGSGAWDRSQLRGLLRELQDRGMIADITHPDALGRFLEASSDATTSGPSPSPCRTLYAGFDPTAPSLHIGNLLVLMVLRRFQAWGHRPIVLVGGATGMVGDPSGRSTERNMQSEEQLARNVRGITRDIRKFLVFEEEPQGGQQQPPQQPPAAADGATSNPSASSTSDAPSSSSASSGSLPCPLPPPLVVPPQARSLLLNNRSWLGSLSLLSFLRDIGRHFRMGPMLNKDSVSSRLNSPAGMSFTEFSYQVLQGYDFMHLHKEQQCSIQVGGSDQWGNITAGVELIQREAAMHAAMQQQQATASATPTTSSSPSSSATSTSASSSAPPSSAPQVFGLTLPLLTTSDGHKFGKSMGNAPVWLSAPSEVALAEGEAAAAAGTHTSSPYELYQFFLTRTADADVVRFLRLFTDHPLPLIAQWEREQSPQTMVRWLAESVTRLVHGESGLRAAQAATAALFGGRLDELTLSDFESVFKGVPSVLLARSDVLGRGVAELAVKVGMCKTKAEARRLITAGGMYVNNVNVKASEDGTPRLLEELDLLCQGRVCVLRSGKKKQFVIRCAEERAEA